MVGVRSFVDRLDGARRAGDGWRARCPAHSGESDDSLSVAEGTDGRVLLHCFGGCSAEEVAEAVGLDLTELGPERTNGASEVYDLRDYAAEKNLPAAELRRWGVETVERKGRSVVAIPYRTARGDTDGVKIRAAGGFWWDSASKLPYGVDRLSDADEDRPVLLVEGESDCHVCWHHDVLALGVPGANSWRSTWIPLLEGREVYVWQEPDEGGEQFVAAVTEDLPEAKVIQAPSDAEDPADLHLQDPEDFRERLSRLAAEAGPRTDEAGDGEEDLGASDLELDLIDAADLLEDPESLRRPEAVIPNVSFRETLTLVSGRPNVAGKTSLLVAGCAAIATGGRRFLGEFAPDGSILWAMAEGAERHIGRYLAQIEAWPPPKRFRILRVGVNPLEELETAVAMLEPDAVVVDSLGTFLAPLGRDMYTEEVVEPLRRIERVARSGPGVSVIHHPRKSDDDPAGSHKIVAICDLVRTIQEGRHDRERVMAGHGRWRLPEVRWQMKILGPHPQVDDLERVRFQVVDEDREVEERILDFLEVNPGASKSAILDGVSGKREAKVDALESLVRAGIVVVDRSGQAHRHWIAENPGGHGTATVGHAEGHASQGQRGDTVAERSPPFSLGKGGTAATPPEAPTSDKPGERTSNTCPECGTRIGPTADVCGGCRNGARGNP